MKKPANIASRWWTKTFQEEGVPNSFLSDFERILFQHIGSKLADHSFVFIFCDGGPKDVLKTTCAEAGIQCELFGHLNNRMRISSEDILMSRDKGEPWEYLWKKDK